MSGVWASRPAPLVLPAVLASNAQALQEPAGVAAGAALRPWGQPTQRVEGHEHTLATLVRTGLRATLKRLRPRHHKNSDVLAAVQARCQEPLQGVMPPQQTRPARLLRQDDSRCGCRTIRRRRLTAGGNRPGGLLPHGFSWSDVDAALAPTTGGRFLLELPALHADIGQLWLDACGYAWPDSMHLWLVERCGAHTGQRRRWTGDRRDVWLPPSWPELNPSERGWRDRKDPLTWPPCTDGPAHQAAVRER